MVGGQADHFDESVVGGLALGAEGAVPRVGASAVARNVEEEHGVDLRFVFVLFSIINITNIAGQ